MRVCMCVCNIIILFVSVLAIHACDKDRIRLMAAAGHVSEMCSKTVSYELCCNSVAIHKE